MKLLILFSTVLSIIAKNVAKWKNVSENSDKFKK